MDNSNSAKPVLGNRYRLQDAIGTGGMAVVYMANDIMLERQVAIKLLRQRYSRDERFREQFHREAKAAANLSHQNIVTIYDFGLDEGRLYIVMEYVPGQDLKTIIRQRGLFPTSEAILLVSQACFGIGYAHRSGLVHCDVKPHNMLVSSNRLKVTDFGIARLLATIQPGEQHDVVWGSPLYFSPEQAAGFPPSPASDVYSLGILLYEMLTGQLPFNSNDPTELARMHREVSPTPPRFINPDIHPTLEQIILKVLEKNPSHRYNNADQLGRVLLSFNRQLEPREQDQRESTILPSPDLSQPVFVNNPAPQNYFPSPGHAALANKKKESEFDWLTIGLGLLTLLMVGGLIPFWLYIWLTLQLPGY